MKLVFKVVVLVVVSIIVLNVIVVVVEEIFEFCIGIFGGENVFDCLCVYFCLEEKIVDLFGVLVKLFVLVDYNGVIEGLFGGNFDMVWLGVFFYVKVYLIDLEVVDLVLVKVNVDGGYGYYFIGFVCNDVEINLFVDMEGRVFGFGDLNFMFGYLILLIVILQEGYFMELGDYFGDVKFIGGYEQIIVVVFNGDIDVGVIWVDGFGEWEDGYNFGVLCKVFDVGLVDMIELCEIWCFLVILEGLIVLFKIFLEDVKIKMIVLMVFLNFLDFDCVYGVVVGEIKGFMLIIYDVYVNIVEVCKVKNKN